MYSSTAFVAQLVRQKPEHFSGGLVWSVGWVGVVLSMWWALGPFDDEGRRQKTRALTPVLVGFLGWVSRWAGVVWWGGGSRRTHGGAQASRLTPHAGGGGSRKHARRGPSRKRPTHAHIDYTIPATRGGKIEYVLYNYLTPTAAVTLRPPTAFPPMARLKPRAWAPPTCPLLRAFSFSVPTSTSSPLQQARVHEAHDAWTWCQSCAPQRPTLPLPSSTG